MQNNRQAFSLIELMVVVAIIGILATIAIPNYQKYSARSHQTYAKSELSGLFTAEKSFQGEYGTYAVRIYDIGFIPEGVVFASPTDSIAVPLKPRYYTIGVSTQKANGTGCPCETLWPTDLPDSIHESGGYHTVAYSMIGYPEPIADVYNTWIETGPYTLSQICDAGTFTATAIGDLYRKSTPVYDYWTINQSRVLKNDISGL